MTPSPLVNAAWLRENLHDPSIRIVDRRFTLGSPDAGLTAYRAGHIPGAVFIDLERDLSTAVRPDRVGGRHPLPSPQQLADMLTRRGIANEHHVIAYDDPATGAAFHAPHLWWILRYLGHAEERVSVLDGGLPAWLAAGGTVEPGEASPRPSTPYQPHPRAAMLANADEVASRGEKTVLVDSRAGERFRGEVEPLDWMAGHIPGAIHHHWADGIGPDGHWKSGPEQRERFAPLQQSPEIIVYCGSGVSAGGNLLALELAGIPSSRVRLYAGSWSDWISGGRSAATGK
jgi:thiosulfate/3-mercaptopyruvate sulfurtransferase